jgi:hypothetical protein
VDGLMADYVAGTIDGVYVTYSKFNSVLSTPPTTDRILPVTPPEAKAGSVQRDYLLFPSAEEILTELLPSYVRNSVYRALVETVAGEQSARRTAMKNATNQARRCLSFIRLSPDRGVGRRGQHGEQHRIVGDVLLPQHRSGGCRVVATARPRLDNLRQRHRVGCRRARCRVAFYRDDPGDEKCAGHRRHPDSQPSPIDEPVPAARVFYPCGDARRWPWLPPFRG